MICSARAALSFALLDLWRFVELRRATGLKVDASIVCDCRTGGKAAFTCLREELSDAFERCFVSDNFFRLLRVGYDWRNSCEKAALIFFDLDLRCCSNESGSGDLRGKGAKFGTTYPP